MALKAYQFSPKHQHLHILSLVVEVAIHLWVDRHQATQAWVASKQVRVVIHLLGKS
jgi:hypothetical protein